MYSHWVTLLIMIVIAIAAVGFILAALTVSTRGHDIYSRLVMDCVCGTEQLCEPVEVVTIANAETHRFTYNNQGMKLKAHGRGYFIPKSGEFIPESFAQPSPDERFHRCTYPRNTEWRPRGFAPAFPGAQYIPGAPMIERQGPEMEVEVPNNSTLDGSPPTRCFFRPNLGA